ncbi:acetyl-CoA carboxylase biotin carboxyl carrier protein subunit [Corynebacterium sp. YIM 101645]|uniref:Acetyl-CoA carboxylase biotin carboxyl carrier protein subunit n=1 Tax=Corynebacterium lemuris TaxID=1859292 RepID=A0ABT2FYP8_9CORY|nr:biotin/lipoyl-containing protein [Corynebacterium lemuris]MCS5479900.1 acetyl-CoA carboxylase biotin carboxyl carrier protein subunit [Corynebacterium lemuris]
MDICAPFAGIVRYHVAAGDTVATGDALATVEAVKLEAPVLAPGPGTVGRLAREDFSDVLGGQLLLEVNQ